MPEISIATKSQELLHTLRRIFQYDRRDLDFGIYRVLNQRRDEIDRFLEEELLPSIEQAFADQTEEQDELRSKLEKAEADARGLRVDPETAPAVRELRERLDERTSPTALADQVYSDLERFFSRYYDDGDFLSLRRYRAGTYAVPYEGEEVLLHWANKDQYYVKSSVNLSALVFTLPDQRRVRLEVVASDELAGTAKPAPGEERRFVLASDPIDASDEKELIVRFAYAKAEKGKKQADLNAESVNALLAHDDIAPWRAVLSGSEDSEGPLEREVTRFTAKNTQDYFIHKNLGGFLRRELDFFVKNELLNVDELEHTPSDELAKILARVRVLRAIARQVIDFLQQIEEFQKRVWLKKKCVLETSWLVTLDRVPEELYPEIAANEAQRKAWVDLLAIDQITDSTADGPAYSAPLDPDFLRRFPYLVLDTRHFDETFTDRLLEALGDLDEATTGVIVYGENFQVLNLLEHRFRDSVSCVYIDAPYNTGGDGFLYKDSYQHSSWLTMLEGRCQAMMSLLANDGVLLCSLNDDENGRLLTMISSHFPSLDYLGPFVWKTRNTDNRIVTRFSVDHEYVHVFVRSGGRIIGRVIDREAWSNPDDDPRGPYTTDPLTGLASAADRPNLHFTIVNDATGDVYEPDPDLGWRLEPGGIEHLRADDRIYWPANPATGKPRKKRFASEMNERAPISSLALRIKQGEGNQDLVALFGFKPMNFPKPTSVMRELVDASTGPGGVVLDCFAGSGTTGQAVIEELRSTGTARQFLLAEVGPHFENILRPRILKTIHSGTWANGVPESRDGVSALIQCLRIESYEDALDGIELERLEAQTDLLSTAPEFRRDYILRYMLDFETRRPLLDRAAFARPFEVETVATVDGERIPSRVDLVSTFNWLLGLSVERRIARDGVRIVRGLDADRRRVLILWRTVADCPNEKLDVWFAGLDDNIRGPTPDIIYVNGDATLQMTRGDTETWEVHLLEAEFERLMFLVADDQAE